MKILSEKYFFTHSRLLKLGKKYFRNLRINVSLIKNLIIKHKMKTLTINYKINSLFTGVKSSQFHYWKKV